MASGGKVFVNQSTILKDITITVHLRRTLADRIRVRFGFFIMHLGAWVMGIGIEQRIVEES